MKTLLIILSFFVLCFQSNASSWLVKNIQEFDSVSKHLFKGDTVRFANGKWDNTEITCIGNGVENQPIVFMAETPGKVIFAGTSKLHISGSYLEVKDFVFQINAITEEGSLIEFKSRSGEADHCRLTNVTIEEVNNQKASPDTKWISLYGTHNRVDHCSLTGKTNSGTLLVVWLDKTPDFHLIDHNYFGPRVELGKNGAETIRIGTSDWERYASNCIVEFNLFEECNGEVEIISNKSVGNEYRFNTFRNCQGTLTLRHGSDCIVHGNFFFGNPDNECGGIRIIGPGHKVYNNYLENLSGTEFRAAICLMNGVPNSPANRYRQVENASVGYNTIINCKQPFAIGAGKTAERSLPVKSSIIVNNLIITNSKQKVITAFDSTEGIIWQGNITSGKNIGLADSSGFQIQDIQMSRKDERLRPASDAIKTKATSGYFDFIDNDIDGQKRNISNKIIGSDEPSNDPITIKPLVKSDVGAAYPGFGKPGK